jgi:hypothetical protein
MKRRLGAMKRTLWLLLAVLLTAILVGCGGGESAPAGTVSEIADRVFAEAQVEPFGMSQMLATDADKELFLGSADYPEFTEAIGVMPMINIDTRVLVLIKAADKGDVADIKAKLKENVDPNRVVCVTFSAEDVAIESRGDVILLTINTDTAQRAALVESFLQID